jgi:hypothetical protein
VELWSKAGGVCASAIEAENRERKKIATRAIDAKFHCSPKFFIFVLMSSILS